MWDPAYNHLQIETLKDLSIVRDGVTSRVPQKWISQVWFAKVWDRSLNSML